MPFNKRNPKNRFNLRAYTLKGIRVEFFARKNSDDLYLFLPYREGEVDEFIRKNLKEGDIFVDCGASIGYYTLIASKIVGDNGKVYSFEANPLSFDTMYLLTTWPFLMKRVKRYF